MAGEPAGDLSVRYTELRNALEHSAFQQPIVLESSESRSTFRGDVYAVLNHPFSRVTAALRSDSSWCEILMLHVNTKYCAPVRGNSAAVLVYVGRKFDVPLADATAVQFASQLVDDAPQHFQASLDASTGPFGTKDYRIVLEAIPINDRTFMHLTYSYGFGMAAKLAGQAYLNTIGRDKVGFTVVEKAADGTPVYVGGMRGALERNAMRYYLAIDAYLSAPGNGADDREARLRQWFASTDRYAKQLHEVEASEYLAMKRSEYLRQETRRTAGAASAR
ncbi:MAG: hypothetical protein M3Z31_05910 [Pseudomonadota bacterium]|nr:hypothetical protein [Pseudomonadota bacterium]